MDFGLKQQIIDKLNTLFEKFPIEKVILYGSRAKGNFKEGSDIDFALTGEKMDSNQLLKLKIAIDELLLPYKIDVSIFDQIDNLDLVEHINRVGKVFYQKKIE